MLEEYGHTHDHAEAATLLDPETRTTLKAALDQMWQSELHLRQGHPERALPYAYRALQLIKQVQQARRIYLARVGPELPPIDESRRMGGDRAGLARRDDALVGGHRNRSHAGGACGARWTRCRRLRATQRHRRSISPRLSAGCATTRRDWPIHSAFVAAIEALRADPDCARCRRDLRALLWPLLPRPATAVPRRDDGDAVGRRYLDALRQEGTQ